MTTSTYLADYIYPPSAGAPVDVVITAPGLVPEFLPLELEIIGVGTASYQLGLGSMIQIPTISFYMTLIDILTFPPLPEPVIPIDEIPAYGEQTPQLANPETPAPEHGVDPVPTERWYPDDQYRG